VDSSTKGYIYALSKAEYKTMQCPFCGGQTAYKGKESFCTICESYLGPKTDGPSHSGSLTSVNADVLNGATDKLDGFLKANPKLLSEPGMLYGVGTLYAIASSYKYHDLYYAREGFMEQNSSNVYASLSMVSRSKEFFYRTLDSLEKLQGVDPVSLYLEFITNMRLNRILDARAALNKMALMNKESAVLLYANMVYAVGTRSKSAMDHIETLAGNGEPNSFYYFARHQAQARKLEDAEAMLSVITEKFKMPMAAYMLQDLRTLASKTST